MSWFKNVLLDIIVTIVIVLAVTTHVQFLQTVVIWYTPVMLLLKIVGAFSGSVMSALSSPKSAAPAWFIYGLYGINIIVLLISAWWWTTAQWCAILVLSVVAYKKISPKS